MWSKNDFQMLSYHSAVFIYVCVPTGYSEDQNSCYLNMTRVTHEQLNTPLVAVCVVERC